MISNLTATEGIFTSLLISIILGLCASWLAVKISRYFNIMDVPSTDPRKIHHVSTPLAGGLAIMIALIPLVFIAGVYKESKLVGLLLSTPIVFAFGLWDDIHRLPPWVKLLGQSLAFIVLVLFDIKVKIFTSGGFFISGAGTLYEILNLAITYLWVIGVTNAYNLVDSMDNIVVGLCGWSFAFFILTTAASNQLALVLLSSCLSGICLALSFFNSSPARLFLGDSGAQTLGFLIAAIGMLYKPPYNPLQSAALSTWFVPILLAGVPIFDTCLVFFSRLIHHKKFYVGDTRHTYHRLIALGLDSSRAVIVMQIICFALNCIAFIAANLPPLASNLIFAGVILMGIGIFIFFELVKYPQRQETEP
jgi:UDP-GlcNAc:undecaprenyl-phosphate GlcNAc-1-phosphate transferase